MAKINASLILPFIIFVLSIFFRTYQLDKYPYFSTNEALLSWRSYSLSQIGTDETGRRYPFIFSSFEGYQLPVSTYIIIPFVKIFGLNINTVRLPFVLISLFSLLCLYFLLCKWTNDKNIPLLTLLVLALSPGYLWFTRVINSVNLALSLLVIGLFLLQNQKKSPFYLTGALLCFVASLYTNQITWLVVIPLLFLYAWYRKHRQILIICGLLFIALLPLLYYYLKLPQIALNIKQNDLSIFSDITTINSINALRGEDVSSKRLIWGTVFHNKVYQGVRFLSSYLQQLNPRLYFASGDQNPLHGLSNFGPLLVVFLPFFLSGLKTLYSRNYRLFIFAFFWCLITTLPSALSFPNQNQEKLLLVLPMLALVVGYGLSTIKKQFLPILAVFIVINTTIILYDALVKEPFRQPEKHSTGLIEQIAATSIRNPDKTINMSDADIPDPAPLLLFFSKYDPQLFSSQTPSFGYRSTIRNVGNVAVVGKEK